VSENYKLLLLIVLIPSATLLLSTFVLARTIWCALKDLQAQILKSCIALEVSIERYGDGVDEGLGEADCVMSELRAKAEAWTRDVIAEGKDPMTAHLTD